MPLDIRRTASVDASTFLTSIDADWARLVTQLGPCGHEPKPTREPFEALVRAVAYQKLHVKAGDAILARLLALHPQPPFPMPAQLLDTGFDAMRTCGFSARKIETIHGIAAATLSGVVPELAAARRMPDDELIARLSALKGIGRWTVEMFLIYSLPAPTSCRWTISVCAKAIGC